MLAPGTLVTVTVQGEAKGLLTKDDLLAGVIQELGDIPLIALASSIDAGSTLYNAISFQWFHYAYKAVLTVSVPADYYDTTNDVAADVQAAFLDVAGSQPTAIQATIAAGNPTIGPPTGGNILPDLGGAIETTTHSLLLIVVALVVLIVLTLGWGKNIGSLARVAAR